MPILRRIETRVALTAVLCSLPCTVPAQSASRLEPTGQNIRFEFDGDVDSTTASVSGQVRGPTSFVRGLEKRALRLRSGDSASTLTIEGVDLPANASFSVQFWVRTTARPDSRMVLVSQKSYPDNALRSQKSPGWVFYMSGGTWAWNIGSGKRRLTYERDNGAHMPLNDGRWHQLTMTYDRELGQVWLYYDGVNKAIYNLVDSTAFDLPSAQSLVAGWPGTKPSPLEAIVPAVHDGREKLQELVDAFHALDVGRVTPEEFVKLIVEPRRLFEEKIRERARTLGDEADAFVAAKRALDFKPVSRVESQLMRNPYTVHQAFSFMEAAPLLKIYSLVDGKVVVDERTAAEISERERLYPTIFDIDNLTVWKRAVSDAEVLSSYQAHFESAIPAAPKKRTSITTGVWNIFHGGLHFTVAEHGWDSRVAIAQILEREGIDVLMMQETYSAGDFIAAELGYYFATTVDWDYLNQGANISVLSRYPIREVRVPKGAAFMNVGARIAISDTQDVWVMSNWYGMKQFPEVFDFHESRFAEADTTPVFFGGDFNAVPHTDGGRSPASKAMSAAGFKDAYRDAYPDAAKFPGPTHRGGRRIDQLYYKGANLHHTSTRVIDSWPIGFPSDHYLIRSVFGLR